VVAIGYRELERRNLDGEQLIGGAIGVIGGLIAVGGGGAAVTTKVVPSSALWMSGIVCSSPSHLEYTRSHFQCVGDAGSHNANYLAILGLQGLLIALVVCAVVAVGGLIWRRRRRR
jgi:hypothetical protein